MTEIKVQVSKHQYGAMKRYQIRDLIYRAITNHINSSVHFTDQYIYCILGKADFPSVISGEFTLTFN